MGAGRPAVDCRAHSRGVDRPPGRGRGHPWGRGGGNSSTGSDRSRRFSATASHGHPRGRPPNRLLDLSLLPKDVLDPPAVICNPELTNVDEPVLQNVEMGVGPTFPEVYSHNSSSKTVSTSSKGSSVNEMGDHGHGVQEAQGHGDIFEERARGVANAADDLESVRFAYRASTWSKEHSTFHPEPPQFTGEDSGTTDEYFDVPTFMHLFRKFWPWDLIRRIRDETNRYAGSLDEDGRTRGRDGWYPTTVAEL
jgi:hypothetical protein